MVLSSLSWRISHPISFKCSADFSFKLSYSNSIRFNNYRGFTKTLGYGLGVKGILGDGTNNGFAVNTGVDIFPAAPISLSTNLNLGFIKSTEVYEFSTKLKYHLERIYFSLGYQQYTAGQVSINGWTLGLGFYL